MASLPKLDDWSQSKPIVLPRAAHLQQVVDGLRAIDEQAGLNLFGGDKKSSFRWLGKIVANGPNDEDSFTDERYWVQWLIIKSEDDPTSNIDTTTDGILNPSIFAVTNLAEAQAGTHNLAVSKPYRIVRVDSDYDDAGQLRWTMDVSPPPLLIKITGNATKSGTYYGKILKSPAGTFDSTAAGTTAAADFGADGQDCTIINASEQGQSTHELTFSGTYLPIIFIGVIIGVDAGNGNPLVSAFMDQSRYCPTPP